MSVARWLRWVAAALLVGLTVRLVAADPAPFRQLAHVDVSVVTAMVLLIVLNQFLTSCRFQLVMKHCAGLDLPAWRWFRLTSIGQFLNLFVPQLAHVYRAVVLQRENRLSYSSYTSCLFVFFWFELLVGLALATIVVPLHDAGFRVAGANVTLVLFVALIGVLGLPRLLSGLGTGWQFRSKRAHQMIATMRASLSEARRASVDPSFVARFVALNVAVGIVQVAMLGLAFSSVGARPDVGRLMLLQVLLKLSGIIIITPGNLGVIELAYGALAGATSTGVQHGIAAALLTRTLGTLVLIALGVVCGGGSVLMRQRPLRGSPGDQPLAPETNVAGERPGHDALGGK